MSRKLKTWLVAVAFVAIVCLHNVALACPTCTNGLGNDPAHSSMVQGYFWSIVFMMSMPFLVLGGISAYFYYEIRRARSRQATAAARSAAQPQLDVRELVTQA